MPSDKYKCFKDLAKGEIEGKDYRIHLVDRSCGIAIIAPHGGTIEPVTSEIAASIAAEDFSLYCFEGLRRGRPHSDLHITSENFDEPKAFQLVSNSQVVIAVHGRSDSDDEETIWVGGLDTALQVKIVERLKHVGFSVEARKLGQPLAGTSRANICNRGKQNAGIQFEIPRTLRNKLKVDSSALKLFTDSVRDAVINYKN